MMTPEKLKELEDITIEFNEYLQTVTENLKHLETESKTSSQISELRSMNS